MFSSKVAGVLALIATIFFLALIGLQLAEWNYYRAEPSIWPTAQ